MVVPHVGRRQLLHLFEDVRVLDVIGQRVDDRIVEMLRHSRPGIVICLTIFPTHGQFVLHDAIEVMPVQLHLFLLLLPLIGIDLIGTFGMLSVVLLFVLKIAFFHLLKPFSLLNLSRELLPVLILPICLSHSLLILIVLGFLHFLLDRFLDVGFLELVAHFVRWYVHFFVVILRLHQHLVILHKKISTFL